MKGSGASAFFRECNSSILPGILGLRTGGGVPEWAFGDPLDPAGHMKWARCGSASGPNSARKADSFAYTSPVKKFLAVIFALISGVYVIFGPFPDPLPFLDEATALLIFVKSMSVLGVDISRFVPFLGKKTKNPPKPPGPVVDV